jgi:ornithine cyclodeaminase
LLKKDATPSCLSARHGKHPGRTDAGQITVCDLTGTGIQDTAIALLAYQKAQQLGLGTPFEL